MAAMFGESITTPEKASKSNPSTNLGLKASGNSAEIRLVASSKLAQRGDIDLLAALHAPIGVQENLEGHNLEII